MIVFSATTSKQSFQLFYQLVVSEGPGSHFPSLSRFHTLPIEKDSTWHKRVILRAFLEKIVWDSLSGSSVLFGHSDVKLQWTWRLQGLESSERTLEITCVGSLFLAALEKCSQRSCRAKLQSSAQGWGGISQGEKASRDTPLID